VDRVLAHTRSHELKLRCLGHPNNFRGGIGASRGQLGADAGATQAADQQSDLSCSRHIPVPAFPAGARDVGRLSQAPRLYSAPSLDFSQNGLDLCQPHYRFRRLRGPNLPVHTCAYQLATCCQAGEVEKTTSERLRRLEPASGSGSRTADPMPQSILSAKRPRAPPFCGHSKTANRYTQLRARRRFNRDDNAELEFETEANSARDFLPDSTLTIVGFGLSFDHHAGATAGARGEQFGIGETRLAGRSECRPL